jgi:hypothetical protein
LLQNPPYYIAKGRPEMTLVEQLNVSLKDFLPERGVTIAYGKPPTVAIVSDRLHQ